MTDVSTEMVVTDSAGKSIWQSIPPFPVLNEENEELRSELSNKKKELGEIQMKIEEQTKVNSLLTNHFNDIVGEIRSVQQILEVRRRQLEAGEHVKKLIEREKSWLVKHKDLIEQEIKEMRAKQNSIKENIENRLEKRRKIQNNLKIDYVSLENWLKEASRKEEDVKILEKYKLSNDSKEKEMQLNIANTEAETKKWKKRVHDRGLEIASMQQECYRLAEDFRSAHLQRKDVIGQLERGINKLRKKDTEIENLFQQLSLISEEQTDLEENNNDKSKFLELSFKDNRVLECDIKSLDLQINSLHQDVQELQQLVDKANTELEIQRCSTNNLTCRISQVRSKEKELVKDIQKKLKILSEVNEKSRKLRENLERWENERLGENNILQTLETTLQKVEEEYKREQKKLERDATTKFKVAKEMENTKSEKKILLSQIDSIKTNIRHFRKRKLCVNKTIQDQQDELYRLDYSILEKEQRVKRRNGETIEDEYVELDFKLGKLKSIYEQKTDYLTFVKSHIVDDEKEVIQIKKKLETFKIQQGEIHDKLDEVKLRFLTCNSELKSVVSKKENLLVDKCILEVKLERLQQILDKNSTSVLNLQKKNLEFESKINFQLNELIARKNILITEARKLDQQCQVMTTRLNKVITKRDHLQTRYKYLMISLGLEEDNDGKEVELLIQTEQEKARLQNELDQLNNTVEKDRDDVKTLKTTLSLISEYNRMYRKCFFSNKEEISRLKEIELERDTLKNKLKHKKQDLTETQNQLSQMKLNTEELRNEIRNLERELEEKHNTLSRLYHELKEQGQRIWRADNSGEKILQSIKDSNILVDEKDITIRLLRELSKQIVSKIVEICAKHPEITNKIRKSFCESALPPLPRFPSRTSLVSLQWTSSSSSTKQSTQSSESNSPSTKHIKTSSRERILASPNVINLDFGPVEIYPSSAGSSVKL